MLPLLVLLLDKDQSSVGRVLRGLVLQGPDETPWWDVFCDLQGTILA